MKLLVSCLVRFEDGGVFGFGEVFAEGLPLMMRRLERRLPAQKLKALFDPLAHPQLDRLTQCLTHRGHIVPTMLPCRQQK